MITPWLQMLGRDRSLREAPFRRSSDDEDETPPKGKDKDAKKKDTKAPPEDVRTGATGNDPRVRELQRRLPNVEPEKKKGRDRSWEERQRNAAETTQVSYRGIPRELNERIKTLAQENDLTVSQVARHLLEWGLEEMESGRRELP